MYKSGIAIVLILVLSNRIVRSLGPRMTPGDAWVIGLLWLSMTVAFEFGAGHYLFRAPWQRLVADYRFWEGRLWTFVLLAELAGPALMAALRKRRNVAAAQAL